MASKLENFAMLIPNTFCAPFYGLYISGFESKEQVEEFKEWMAKIGLQQLQMGGHYIDMWMEYPANMYYEAKPLQGWFIEFAKPIKLGFNSFEYKK